ncbi:MAG: EAL domain-containing protein, partial [Nostoc sp.]
MADRAAAAMILALLRNSGVSIAIDDFGTGYSSLSHLPNLPFDTIKIDRSFVAKLGEGEAHHAIVRAIIALSTSLGASCTAEGVETEAQLVFLAQENCTTVQGYLLGYPLM